MVAVGYTSDTIRNLPGMLAAGLEQLVGVGQRLAGLVTCTQMVSMSPPSLAAVEKRRHISTVW
jgi:hypothetical protein